ncbi:hypothetical protein LG3211_3644 [Lysobacter gummosus]|nr:hypothetical protein LG3211_3644 [Lysobacter gummosus]
MLFPPLKKGGRGICSRLEALTGKSESPGALLRCGRFMPTQAPAPFFKGGEL